MAELPLRLQTCEITVEVSSNGSLALPNFNEAPWNAYSLPIVMYIYSDQSILWKRSQFSDDYPSNTPDENGYYDFGVVVQEGNLATVEVLFPTNGAQPNYINFTAGANATSITITFGYLIIY